MKELIELFAEKVGRYPRGNVQDELRAWSANEIITLRQQLAKSEARVAELEGQFHVKQLASLMRGLEVKPGFGSMPPEGFYALGRAITDQAKAATEPAILRKQAEAVEAATKACEIKSATDDSRCYSVALLGYADRLKRKAAEAERAGGEHG
ncbi:hypothetical protein [Marinobacter nauticus]|uniref:Uncharacterized protein n=1 Tax=Marinobacter nauticus TaxID=2743 RepID=A0A833JPJ0_MARNT|nr:hypothetical protein [Marinobacter nauticus]KAE8545398.1 hypothetical protein F6453_2370 [Marinobacter nauticus]